MKRSRIPLNAAAGGVSPAVFAQAKERLEADYVALVMGTSSEDPRFLVARIAAAGEVLDHLVQLGTLAASGAPDDAGTNDAVLAAARAGMARENKT